MDLHHLLACTFYVCTYKVQAQHRIHYTILKWEIFDQIKILMHSAKWQDNNEVAATVCFHVAVSPCIDSNKSNFDLARELDGGKIARKFVPCARFSFLPAHLLCVHRSEIRLAWSVIAALHALSTHISGRINININKLYLNCYLQRKRIARLSRALNGIQIHTNTPSPAGMSDENCVRYCEWSRWRDAVNDNGTERAISNCTSYTIFAFAAYIVVTVPRHTCECECVHMKQTKHTARRLYANNIIDER